jgi:hypothetical protein
VFTSFVLLTVASPPASGQTTDASNKKLVTDARAAYYSLVRHNFGGFSANIEPDWKTILADTATSENLKVFRSQHFSMTVDANGVVSVNREFDEAPRAKSAAYIKQIHENVQRLLSGFFGTWSFFMIRSPFPDPPFKVESRRQQSRISYSVLSTEVELITTSDFLITASRLSDVRVTRTIKPTFQKTSEGFLLLSYQTAFEPVGPGKKTTTETSIEYIDVSGMKLPVKIHIKGLYGAEPFEAELKFNEHILTARRD